MILTIYDCDHGTWCSMCLWSLGSRCMIHKPLECIGWYPHVGNFHVASTSHIDLGGAIHTLDVEDENMFTDLAFTHTIYK